MRAAVLTSVMDNYDTLKPVMPQDGADVQWVCFTDSETLAAEAVDHIRQADPALRGGDPVLMHPTGWEIVYYARPADEHPNRAAKKPKTHPAMFTDAPASVWIDASFQVFSPRFVVDTLTIAREDPSGIAQFAHPWRDDFWQEANTSVELPKYRDQIEAITLQQHVYDQAGMPRNWGLWATGVIAREHRPEVIRWGQRWAAEIRDHSYQDQISHPYVSWACGLRPASLPGSHFVNPWVYYAGSGRH